MGRDGLLASKASSSSGHCQIQRTGGIPRLQRAITEPDGRGSRSSNWVKEKGGIIMENFLSFIVRGIYHSNTIFSQMHCL
jgi:hypothetical protein